MTNDRQKFTANLKAKAKAGNILKTKKVEAIKRGFQWNIWKQATLQGQRMIELQPSGQFLNDKENGGNSGY